MATEHKRGRRLYGPFEGSAGGTRPGVVLEEELEARGWSQSELARRMKRLARTVNEIIRGKRAVSAPTALDLEAALGIAASLWLGMETDYQLAQARLRRHAGSVASA